MRLFTLLSSLSLLFVGFAIQAQVVTFMSELLLNSIDGFSYEDCTLDMNGDKLDDIVRVTNSGMYIDYQHADGTFTQTFFEQNFSTLPTWSMCGGDLNKDGKNDLLFGSGNRVSFVYSNASGTEYTEVAHPEYIFSQRSTMADIDNDGDLDAFVCHDVDQSHPYRNDGTGAMTLDQTLIETSPLAGNYAALWVDFDNDWDTDLYITKCRQGSSSGDAERTNLLYRNNGDGTYTEMAADVNMADNAQSWTTVFEDFDNDGDFDAFIVNHDFKNRFLVNDGQGNFTDIIDDTGINAYDLGAWENAAADFNNDGYIDIFSEMSKELYLNNGDLTFTPIDLPMRSGGIGDFNNDGFLDVINGNMTFINQGNDNNWIKINTEGILSNPNGIGSRVEIYGEWGMQIREVRSTQSFSNMSSLTVSFGIGQSTEIDSIVVKWPSGVRTLVKTPDINSTVNIPEAECILDPIAVNIDGDLEICPGETVTLTAPEGFDSYAWKTGETTRSIVVGEAGSYNLTAFNEEGCISLSNTIDIYYVAEPDVPSIQSATDAYIICEGTSLDLNTDTALPASWSTGESGSTITVSEAGIYTVSIDSVCNTGKITSAPFTLEVVSVEAPEVEIDFSGIPGSGATLTATGNNISWYDMPMGGTLVASGNTFATDPIEESTVFFAQDMMTTEGDIESGGKLDNSGGGGIPPTPGYSFFNVWEEFNLISVDVFVPNDAPEGTRTFTLNDANGDIMESIAVDLIFGWNTVELNWMISPGENYSLRCAENNIFRNNTDVSYPYPIGESLGEVHSSLYGLGYYYFFYNWVVQKPGITCLSETVAAEIIVVDVKNFPELNSFELYPIPANDRLILDIDSDKNMQLDIQLINALGQTVLQQQQSIHQGINKHHLDVSQLSAGIYSFRIMANGKATTKEIIIE